MLLYQIEGWILEIKAFIEISQLKSMNRVLFPKALS